MQLTVGLLGFGHNWRPQREKPARVTETVGASNRERVRLGGATRQGDWIQIPKLEDYTDQLCRQAERRLREEVQRMLR